jgi:hypothetical protein
MAITLVNVAENSGSGASYNVTLPTLLENDVVYLFVGSAGALGLPGTVAVSGYAKLIDVNHTALAHLRYYVFRKKMGAVPDTVASIVSTGGNPDISCAVAVCLRGVDQTTPEDATTTTAGFTNSTNPDSPSITTVTPGAWVISGFGITINDAAVTMPSGYANQVDRSGTGGGSHSTVGAATIEKASAGAENPASWTNVATGQWYAVSIAVRPAADTATGNMLLMF